jgi:hypothetical protein
MPLGKNADARDYVKDFYKSKAPQFKGKSKAKRRQMAVAAYLDKKDSVKEDAPTVNTGAIPNPADTAMGPRFKPRTVHDRRKKKGRPLLLKRFRDYYNEKGIG